MTFDKNSQSLGERDEALIERAEALGVDPADIAADGSIKPYVAPVFELPEVIYSNIADLGNPEGVAGDPPPGDDFSVDAGWCPNGSWSEGICRPFNNSRDNWMLVDMRNSGLRVQDMIIPGTHNSGADKNAPNTGSNMTCQDVSPYDQLHAGIRAFDLRLKFYSGYTVGDPRRFMIVHGDSTGRTFKGDVLDALTRFRSDNGGRSKSEVVILDLHSLENASDAAEKELINLTKAWGGAALAPQYLWEFSIAQLIALNKTTIVAWHWQRDPAFWYGVNQRWIGYSVTESHKLEEFADKVVKESKEAWELRALQYHKHTGVLLVPDDISDRVMSRSSSENEHSPIQGLYIFNTDWSLRHRMVDNCIHGNGQRAKARGERTLWTSYQEQPELTMPIHPCCVYNTHDGNVPPQLTVSRAEARARVIYSHDATATTSLYLTGVINHGGIAPLIVSKGQRISFKKAAGWGPWEICGILHTPPTDVDVWTVQDLLPGELFTFFQTAANHWTPDIRLPASAHHEAILVIISRKVGVTTVHGGRITTGLPVQLSNQQQCALQFDGATGKWRLVGGPVSYPAA